MLVCVCASMAFSIDQGQLERILSQPILDPIQTLNEVEVYAGSQVPQIPTFSTAEQWSSYAKETRAEVLSNVMLRGEAAKWAKAPCKVEWLETISGGPGYHIRKVRFEALPGFWIPALLYVPDHLSGKVPAVLEVNGHDMGKVQDNKQIRSINEAKRGMIVLNPDWVGTGQLISDSHFWLNEIDLCGTSGVGVFYLALERALDVLLSVDHVDPNRVAVTGYSGGGWQTIIISSLDTRVKLANPVAGFTGFLDKVLFPPHNLGDPEQEPADLARFADFTILAQLMAPRPTLFTNNGKESCCFRADNTLPFLMHAALPVFRLLGAEGNLEYHINYNPGIHNYGQNNREAFYEFLGKHFYPDDKDYSWQEIPSEDELKTAEHLHVDLPANNEDLNSLAISLSRKLPRDRNLPTEKTAAELWRKTSQEKLRGIVRAKDYQVVPRPVLNFEEVGGLKVTLYQLKLSGIWTVPAVMFDKGKGTPITILVSDKGRKTVAAETERLLHEGRSVLAVDPLYFGESKIVPLTQEHDAEQDYYFALLLSGLGDRLLGLDASQLCAIARWQNHTHASPVEIDALGPRTSLAALVAASLESRSIGSLKLDEILPSLKEVIERKATIQQAPEALCFGLLEWFDIPQLIALVAPRPVTVSNPTPRLEQGVKALENYFLATGVHLNSGPSRMSLK